MLELRTFGAVGLLDARDARLALSPKPLALLVYLAAARPRGPQRRHTLVALFHPELDHGHARAALRQLVHGLRAVVGAEVVRSDRATVALDTRRLDCDVHAFEAALAVGDPGQAAAVYGGPFLSGFFLNGCPEFERWVDSERNRLQQAYVEALERLALAADAAGEADEAVARWWHLSDVNPYAARVTVRLMAALEVAGDRAGALRVAEQHALRLKVELEAEPSPEVEAVARRLRLAPAPSKPVAGGSTRERLARAVAGRYRVERVVGAGGMALVYLAEDVKLGRPVALKVLRPELAAALGHERFLSEVSIAAGLAHPNILPLHDAGEAEGLLYYVMPYVEGESLRARLAREGPFAVAEAVRITGEVADALAHAHERGIVHRDIKPANILLLADHAVVSDFGVARALGEAVEDRALVATTGTLAYMSPEQVAGSPDLDGRSDLYSLGCVLHEMVTGMPPPLQPNPPAIEGPTPSAPVPPTSPLGSLPAALEAALIKALAPAPAQRFATAGEFADALRAKPVSVPPRRKWRRTLAGYAAVAILAIIGAYAVFSRAAGPPEAVTAAERPRIADPRMAIAVLPFQNLSADGPHAYFAGGLHDELLTQLTKVGALSVRGRSSVMGYAGASKSMKEIAEELAVGTIVEASVQVVAERLRVNVQLLDAATDQVLWADRYDGMLDDAFAIQSEMAQQIVDAVGATLSRTERTAIAEPPTANAEAYRLYLQAQDYDRRPGYERQDRESAQRLYEGALAQDPDFALAHAALARIHGQMSWFRYDVSPERLDRQREEAETALRLAPDLPQAHMAMGGVHYQGRRDWQAALVEYRIALRYLPNDAYLWAAIGYSHRRMGNLDSVYTALATATQLDPRAADLFFDLGGNTFWKRHRYADAMAAYNRALTLAPDLQRAAVWKGLVYVQWTGELDTLRAALERVPADELRLRRVQLLLWERNPDSLLAFLGKAGVPFLDGMEPVSLVAAWGHQMLGDDLAAHAAFDAARSLLDSVVRAEPDNAVIHALRGLALAGMGRRREALQEARWVQQSVAYREDLWARPDLAEQCAMIFAQIGEVDAALDEIERILAGTGFVSVHTLRLDPRWDPIRDDPRFQALLVKYDPPQPVEVGKRP